MLFFYSLAQVVFNAFRHSRTPLFLKTRFTQVCAGRVYAGEGSGSLPCDSTGETERNHCNRREEVILQTADRTSYLGIQHPVQQKSFENGRQFASRKPRRIQRRVVPRRVTQHVSDTRREILHDCFPRRGRSGRGP